MTVTKPPRARRSAERPPPADPEVKESLTRIRERNHLRDNIDAMREAIDASVARAVAGLNLGRGESKADVPVWMKIAGAAMAIIAPSAVVMGLMWTLAIAPVVTRLAAQEARAAETTAALVALSARAQASETKLAQMETQLSTATRIRDQQQQGTSDRMRALELADQAGTQQLNTLAQNLAGLVARMEEMLRRQERLENRLSSPGTRQGADEAPAVYAPRSSII